MDYNGIQLDPAVGQSDNSIKGVQHVDISTYTLSIEGLVNTPLSLKYDEVMALSENTRLVTLHCVTGWDATLLFHGVLLTDVIDLADAKPEVKIVIFHCIDGYTTSLPLDTIISRELILAYDVNELTLPPELGFPFIVVAEDKQGYKWARWVTKLELSADENYTGYWETKGFDNEAEID